MKNKLINTATNIDRNIGDHYGSHASSRNTTDIPSFCRTSGYEVSLSGSLAMNYGKNTGYDAVFAY